MQRRFLELLLSEFVSNLFKCGVLDQFFSGLMAEAILLLAPQSSALSRLAFRGPSQYHPNPIHPTYYYRFERSK